MTASSRRPEQGNSLAAEQVVGLGNLIERRTIIEDRQELIGANGRHSAMIDCATSFGVPVMNSSSLSVNPPVGAGASGTFVFRRSYSATKLFKR